MKPVLIAGLLALGLGIAPANAAPGVIAPAGLSSSMLNEGNVEPVHLRRYRHCHRTDWRRWCHGPHYRYRYGAPGVYLHFGPRVRGYGWRGHRGWQGNRGWRGRSWSGSRGGGMRGGMRGRRR
jgi:hypothetical protein